MATLDFRERLKEYSAHVRVAILQMEIVLAMGEMLIFAREVSWTSTSNGIDKKTICKLLFINAL